MAGKACGIIQSIQKSARLAIRRTVVVIAGRLGIALEFTDLPFEKFVLATNGFSVVLLDSLLL